MNNKEKDTEKNGENGNVVTTGGGYTFHCVTVIGQIEGHYLLPDGQKSTKYEHVLPLLVAIEQDDRIDGVAVLLNTVGGDVEAGLAIAELLAGMKKPKVSLVLGGGHSIGIPIAVSCDTSFIVPSATMTVHPVRMNGTVLGVPQSFTALLKMQGRVNKFITAHSSVSSEKLCEMLNATDELTTDVGTVLDGTQAVECGLIDRIGSLSDAMTELKRLADINKKADK